jgi:hypothetical protein
MTARKTSGMPLTLPERLGLCVNVPDAVGGGEGKAVGVPLAVGVSEKLGVMLGVADEVALADGDAL